MIFSAHFLLLLVLLCAATAGSSETPESQTHWKVFLLVGVSYLSNGEIRQAIEYLQEALSKLLHLHDGSRSADVSQCCSLLKQCYVEQGDIEHAKEYQSIADMVFASPFYGFRGKEYDAEALFGKVTSARSSMTLALRESDDLPSTISPSTQAPSHEPSSVEPQRRSPPLSDNPVSKPATPPCHQQSPSTCAQDYSRNKEPMSMQAVSEEHGSGESKTSLHPTGRTMAQHLHRVVIDDVDEQEGASLSPKKASCTSRSDALPSRVRSVSPHLRRHVLNKTVAGGNFQRSAVPSPGMASPSDISGAGEKRRHSTGMGMVSPSYATSSLRNDVLRLSLYQGQGPGSADSSREPIDVDSGEDRNKQAGTGRVTPQGRRRSSIELGLLLALKVTDVGDGPGSKAREHGPRVHDWDARDRRESTGRLSDATSMSGSMEELQRRGSVRRAARRSLGNICEITNQAPQDPPALAAARDRREGSNDADRIHASATSQRRSSSPFLSVSYSRRSAKRKAGSFRRTRSQHVADASSTLTTPEPEPEPEFEPELEPELEPEPPRPTMNVDEGAQIARSTAWRHRSSSGRVRANKKEVLLL